MADFEYGFASYGKKKSVPSWSPIDIPKPAKKKKKKQITPRQMALLLYAMEHPTHRSFGSRLKGVGKGALGGATWMLDKLMRPSWAVTGAVSEAQKEARSQGDDRSLGSKLDILESFAHGAKKGFTGKSRKGFGEVLKENKVLIGHSWTRAGVGFGLDVMTDPLMLLSLGADVPSGGAATAAYMAAKTSGKAVSPRVIKMAAQEAGKKALKGETDNISEELLSLGGTKFRDRLAYLKHNKAMKESPVINQTMEDVVARQSESALHATRAYSEAGLHDSKRLYLTYGTRGHHLKVPIAPALARPGSRLAQSGIPVISQLSDTLGRAFIPDFKNPIIRAGKVGRQHVAEGNAKMQGELIGKITKGVDVNMSPDHFLDSLHYMEKPLKVSRGTHRWKAVLTNADGSHKLNERYIDLLKKKGLIDHSQEDAIRKYFLATEALFKMDRAAGVQVGHFGDTGRMYVPHITLNTGDTAVPTVSQRGLLTEAGFEKGRKGNFSIKEIKQLVEDGKLPKNIETNPWKLLAHRSRAGAERQADMALINTLKASVGVPTRIVDEKAVFKAATRQEAAIAKQEAAVRAAAHAEDAYDEGIQVVRKTLDEHYDKGIKTLAKQGRVLKSQARDRKIKALTKKIEDAKKPPAPVKLKKAPAVAAKLTPAQKEELASLTLQSDEASKLLLSLPEDFPRHNAKILSSARQYDHLDDALNDFDDIKRADYEQGLEGTDEFHADKQGAWEDVLAAQEDHLAEVSDDLKLLKEDHAALAKKPVKAPKAAKAPVWKPNKTLISNLEKEIVKAKRAPIMSNAMIKHEAETLDFKENYQKAITKLANPRSKEHKFALGEELLTHKTAKATLADAKKELRASNAALKTATKGKKNIAFKKGLMATDPRATDKYGHPFAFPQEEADSIMRLERLVSGDDSTVENFVRAFGKWQGAWKVAVTIMSPGYRIRNTMTDFWNMWLAGVNPYSMGKYGIQAARTMKAASKGHPTEAKWIKEAADQGILSGLFAGDIARVEKYFRYGGDARALRHNHQYGALTVKIMQDFNKNAENWGRMTHYLYRRKALKESVGEAAFKVKNAHFDYSDLTPFEQKMRDTVFPFYTWTRKNIPYQVKMIFKEPGRYSAFPKLVQEAQFASGNPNDIVPDYVESGFGFPIGKNRFYMPQFGVSDLQPFQGPGEAVHRAASMLSPAIKTPIELMMNKSMFTGQEIASSTHPRAPVSALGAKVLSFLPGSNVGTTERGGLSGPGANPYYAYLLGQIPGTRLAGVTGPGSIKAQQSHNAPLLSWLGGQSVVQNNPAQQAYFESLHQSEEVDKLIRGLRDMNKVGEPDRKKSDFEKLIESILKGNYSGR